MVNIVDTAEVLLPLPGSGVDLGSVVVDDKSVVGVHRELGLGRRLDAEVVGERKE